MARVFLAGSVAWSGSGGRRGRGSVATILQSCPLQLWTSEILVIKALANAILQTHFAKSSARYLSTLHW
jgi:hypothetical protein